MLTDNGLKQRISKLFGMDKNVNDWKKTDMNKGFDLKKKEC